MSKKQHSVVIAGYYGFGNAGDELILLSQIQRLRKEHPDCQITVLSARPAETAARLDVKAVNRWNPWSWIQSLWNAELFILGGGGLLQETTHSWNSLYYLALVAFAKIFSCRTEVRAIGVDPIGRWWSRIFARFVFNHLVNFVSVRDADSQRALESIGIHVRLWRSLDPAFYLSLPKIQTAPRPAPKIAWVISAWPQRPGWNHDVSFLLQRVAKELNVTNELLPFFREQDEPLSRSISELTSFHASVRSWERLEDLLSWTQEYDLIIGMRYHALVLAALAQKTFIGWGYQRKVRTLCRDFNQPLWTFERGWDSEAVFRQIADAWKRRVGLAEHHREQIDKWIAAPAVATETARIFIAQA